MLNVLKYAARHCLCNSPWENTCAKCKDYSVIMQEKATEVARAIDENLVYLDLYNHVVLLPKGDTICRYSRGNYAAEEESEDED